MLEQLRKEFPMIEDMTFAQAYHLILGANSVHELTKLALREAKDKDAVDAVLDLLLAAAVMAKRIK